MAMVKDDLKKLIAGYLTKTNVSSVSVDASGTVTPITIPSIAPDEAFLNAVSEIVTYIQLTAEVAGQVVLTSAVGGMVAGMSPAGPITGALTGAAPVTGTIVTPSTTKVL